MDALGVDVDAVDTAIGQLTMVFQPIVDLRSEVVVGYEALARWPSGSALRQVGWPHTTTLDRNLRARIDWACRAAAYDVALRVGMTPDTSLFVNVEPETIDSACPSQWRETMRRGALEVQTVVEVTERDLAARPAELLRVIEETRAQGVGIALDDVGSDWRSLALLPIIQPDVVKLDMHLIQDRLSVDGALIAEAVRAYAARSGAEIVAEGIETEAHLQRAVSLGATLGQGWYFGDPGWLPVPETRERGVTPELIVSSVTGDHRSPMDAIAQRSTTTIATKRDLVAVSRSFERRALDTTEPCVILSLFQDAEWFTPATAQVYAQLAKRSAFVGAFGPGMPSEPAPGVRGADLAINQSLLGEWSVILIAPHYTGALIAQDLGDSGPEMERRFRFAVLHDRDLVQSAARSLMLKMTALA